MTDRRNPCAQCGAPILIGAKKCRACKNWQAGAINEDAHRLPRAAVFAASLVATVLIVLATSGESKVAEAPPLTPMAAEPSSSEPSPAAIGTRSAPALPKADASTDDPRDLLAREIFVGDIHPLDLAFSKSGDSLYVSGSDASLREYTLGDGKLIHQASLPTQGARLRVLFDRYVALIKADPRVGRIAVMDTRRWDRDPVLLRAGFTPTDIVEHPDGDSVVTASADGRRLSRFALPSGNRLADITLPQATTQLLQVHVDGKPTFAALGTMSYGGRPAGGWIERFDPSETPFAATRHAVPVGHSPSAAAVVQSGQAVVVTDRAANELLFAGLRGAAELKRAPVGASPESVLVMNGDRYAITLSGQTETASVVDLTEMEVVDTLMLSGAPKRGVVSPDGKTLFLLLGGAEWPAREGAVAVISGTPPRLVRTVKVGRGASSIAMSADGGRVAVGNYFAKSVTLLE